MGASLLSDTLGDGELLGYGRIGVECQKAAKSGHARLVGIRCNPLLGVGPA
jgi:hypothetical protein